MRVLADENVPATAVEELRGRGHDVAWVRADAPGSTDRSVLSRAAAEKRLLITFDKDFGELAFHAGLPAPSGVILFRLSLSSPTRAAQLVASVLEGREDWAGHFAVVEEDRIRMTPLPPHSSRG